jgi:hypothetical protein
LPSGGSLAPCDRQYNILTPHILLHIPRAGYSLNFLFRIVIQKSPRQTFLATLLQATRTRSLRPYCLAEFFHRDNTLLSAKRLKLAMPKSNVFCPPGSAVAVCTWMAHCTEQQENPAVSCGRCFGAPTAFVIGVTGGCDRGHNGS